MALTMKKENLPESSNHSNKSMCVLLSKPPKLLQGQDNVHIRILYQFYLKSNLQISFKFWFKKNTETI